MHAKQTLHRWLSNVLPEMHSKRREALSTMAGAALSGGRLTVTQLGRSIGGLTKEKHNIKRADRLLSNRHLQLETIEVYKALCHLILGDAKRPIIAVDWSALDENSNHSMLRAAAIIEGRTLTLYEEVHDISTKEKPKTHANFLDSLKLLLPKECSPIITTDSAFRKPWFKKIQQLGWDFVGRVRNTNRVQLNNQSMLSRSLYSQATTTPTLLGSARLTAKAPIDCNLVLYKTKPKGRIKKSKLGKRERGKNNPKHEKSAKDPWLLATSLKNAGAKEIVRIYSTRMQIEESFRTKKGKEIESFVGLLSATFTDGAGNSDVDSLNVRFGK